jgi:hypothetical protein
MFLKKIIFRNILMILTLKNKNYLENLEQWSNLKFKSETESSAHVQRTPFERERKKSFVFSQL